MNLSRKDENKYIYRNTFFDNEMVKTFLIQTFYNLMTSLASNNVLNARPIFLFTIYIP